MSNRILISVGQIKIEAELLDTPTAQNIKDSLPFASKAQAWGDEIFLKHRSWQKTKRMRKM